MSLFKKFTNKFTAPEASVQLKLTSYSVALGENLQGNLNVNSKEDFETTEVRCEIVCTEQAKVIKQVYDPDLKRSIPQVVTQTTVVYNAKPPLCGSIHFTNGENRNFAINANIPAGATPTQKGLDRKVTWTIKGVLAVDGRPDRTTETQEVQVVAPSAQATIQREVIRTVVMIPCKYCQNLMDHTLTTCPNCGAKRTL